MKKISHLIGVLAVGGLMTNACSSSSDKTGHGGSTSNAGTTGNAGATAGTTGSAGAAAGASGSAGGATAGASGSAGATAGSSGTGGAGGTLASGGTGGTACVGDPPITEHNMCTTIASQKKGDAGFTITSPDFSNCGVIPSAMTCDGKTFGTGSSPTLTWSGAPAGTMSYALVFKDIAILADNDPTKDRFGYHWVMWDIPASKTGLPPGLTGGYHSTEVSGALQWSGRNNYAYFPPCPNPFPRDDSRFTCSLVIDSYAYTLYALPVAKLTDLPAPDLDATTGQPTGNYVVKMGHYLESLSSVLAVTEYRGTSQAWSTSFPAPPAVEYPCSSIPAPGTGGAGGAAGAGGTAGAGGAGGTGGGAPMCLQ